MMLRQGTLVATTVVLAASLLRGPVFGEQNWPFEITDLTGRSRLVILVFGDAGTGNAGQYRVGSAMADVCRERRCDLALMLGDLVYEDGIEVSVRDRADASFAEIIRQFDAKFARPYRGFEAFPGFHFWAVLGNHDIDAGAPGAFVTYSRFNSMWRMPAQYYRIPRLPSWLHVQAIHTDTNVRRDLNGLQVAALRQDLCAGEAERWKLAFGHQPLYNSGHHGGGGDERRARALLEPLFRECGVHVYFSGHSHHQEHLTAPGFEQVIQGAAGKSKSGNDPPSGAGLRQRFFARTFGFGVVEVDRQRLRMDFYDVLDTAEKARSWVPPGPDEIVNSYSWCATREDIGRADRTTAPCPPL